MVLTVEVDAARAVHLGAWSTSRSPDSTAGSSSSPTRSAGTATSVSATAHPGLGKTLSARTYAAADDYEHWFANRYRRDSVIPTSLMNSRTLMYTPDLTITARRLNLEVGLHVDHLSSDIERVLNPGYDPSSTTKPSAAPNWSSSTRRTG